ncbi:MAG: PKD domain-containing protein [Chitinophagaceae bacterium]
MKRFLLIVTTFLLSKTLLAEHITGGEMYYRFTGMSGGNYQYLVTLKLYRDCFSAGAQLDASAAIGVFNRSTGLLVYNELIPMTKTERLQLGSPGPCITDAPIVCYQVGYYEFSITLPASLNGYTVAYQRCCRINGISNLSSSGSMGATYVADIPGTSVIATAPENSSAKFIGTDTVIVCGGYPFTYSFAAVDPDTNDELSYSFCEAYVGGGQGGGQGGGANTPAPNPPLGPPYQSVNYSFPYNGYSPLGAAVTIDPVTGLISGKAPAEGIYVVTVCVNEIRAGKIIATQRKDLQIKAGGCDIAKAQLDPEYISCDGFTLTFNNLSNSPMINSYYWEFGDPGSGAANNSSALKNPTHTYSVAGDYTLKLVTNRNQECSDSTTATVRVWPGFFPDFTSVGVCLINPVRFTDRTTTNYGVVDKWRWDFGQVNATNDTSNIRNPDWTYADTGTKNVRFIVGNSKGCIDTIFKSIKILDKPPITLAFRDTLICVPDNLQLRAAGTGVFSWTPVINMVNANTATPTVNPTTTTTYTVQLDDQGCVNSDTVRVRVVRVVTTRAMADTTICLTDSVQLNITSDGLRHEWTPTASLNDPTLQNPMALPTGTTNYQVTARIGSCTATENILVRTVPYPVADAGADTIICYNTPAFLNGTHDGNTFTWSPAGSLVNANTLNPVAYPTRTPQEYVLTSFDTDLDGCKKPGYDTVVVSVLPQIQPFAGNDTLVIVGQPLQFNADGGVSYLWTPPTGLSSTTIKNPVGIYGEEVDSVHYTVEVFNEIGCSDSAFVSVTVFKTNPYVFVPSAFTPNGDGLNDVIRPIAVGVQQIKYFRIFNRWGQMVFHTTTNEHGWDGKISGAPQGSNVFVWMVSAIDYLGKPIFLKGTVTLIR